MDKTTDSTDALSADIADLGTVAVAGAEGTIGADAPVAADLTPDAAPAAASRRRSDPLDEKQRQELRVSFNNRISQLCKLVALVISVVTFATAVLGKDDPHFVVLGLSLSVALLAIALLQDSYHPKR